MKQKLAMARTHKAQTAINTIANSIYTPRLPACLIAIALAAAAWLTTPSAQARAPQAPAPSASAPTHCPPAPQPSPADYQAEAQRPHPDQGVLWELRKGEQTAYLLGSMHLGQLPWIFPGPRTAQALQSAPAIALELDPLDPHTQHTLMQAMATDSEAQQRIMRNNPRLQTRMDAMARSLCVDKASWQNMATIPRIITLGMSDVARDGYHVVYGIDLNLAAMARAGGKPTIAIETAQEQLDALGLGGGNAPSQLATPDDISKALGDIQSGKNRALTRDLARYWQSGDLQAVQTLMRDCNCMDDLGMKSALLDERNRRMAERIPALIHSHPQLFIAVGLLHMVGDNNLLVLLQKQGFAVRQLTGKMAPSGAATPAPDTPPGASKQP